MRGRIMERLSEERGVAIITALLVSLIIVTLGATSVTIAIHNSESSALDRRRVTGVAAAEAGIDYYFSHLQSATAPSSFQCAISQNMNTTPATSFSATVRFYDTSGTQMTCPPATDPDTALIRSVGKTNVNETPPRTMEAYVRLVPRPGNPFGTSVVYSNTSIDWNSNITILGEDASNSNVYSNGNISFGSSTVIYGSVYAQGSISLRGNTQVRRDAWANGSLTLSNNAAVLGNGTSSVSAINVRNAARIHRDAQAGTSITANSTGIGGLRIQNSPQGPPPVSGFPSYTFDANAWAQSGYSVQIFSGSSACTNAKNFIRNNITGGSYVIRITADCTLAWNRDTPTLVGNLAIISDGGMSNANQTVWAPAAGQQWGLFMIFGIDGDGAPCDITWGAGSRVEPGLTTFTYTPCTVDLSSNVYLNEGQIFGGSVRIGSNSGIKYRQVGIPGYGNEAYDEDVLYVREIVTGS